MSGSATATSLAGCCPADVVLGIVIEDSVTISTGTVQLFPDGALIDDDVEVFIEDEGEVFFV